MSRPYNNCKFRSLFVLVGLAVLLAACDNDSDKVAKAPDVPRPVKVMLLKDASAAKDLVFSGQVRAFREANLSFDVSGTLRNLPVLEGQVVKKGALIARLDQKNFQLTVNENQAKVNQAKGEFDRAAALISRGNVSQAVFDKRKTVFDVATVRLNQAKKNLNDSTLRAPFVGRIARRFVDNFQRVNKGQQIVSIQDVSRLEVHADVPEAVIATVDRKAIDKISASFEFLPDRNFNLKVKERSTQADPATKTFRVVFSMPAPKGAEILPGMSSSVRITSKASAGSTQYLIPSSAVISDASNKFFVWLVDPTSKAVTKTSVEVGEFTGDKIFVLKGLSKGQLVVIAGANFMREGMKVVPVIASEGNL